DMPLRAAALPAAAPAAGAAALRDGVAAAGGCTARFWVTLLDCMPRLRPPPARRASASNGMASMETAERASSAMAKNREKRCDIRETPVDARTRAKMIIAVEP